eukprot:TRINITY_DN4798_c0_g2_i1.p4 TRINITY_DN4798_c0_g2~~TRINITY_DN4798_c0_g2_i1.p4  ORF type:complete len:231 (+),score=38.24 TRINITY_DN4798_c0_g2_i1:850-1542(+)
MGAQGAAVVRAAAVEAVTVCHLRRMVRAAAAAVVVAATPLAAASAGPHPSALHRQAGGTPSQSCRRPRGAWRPCGRHHLAPKAPAAAGSAAASAPRAALLVSDLGVMPPPPVRLGGTGVPAPLNPFYSSTPVPPPSSVGGGTGVVAGVGHHGPPGGGYDGPQYGERLYHYPNAFGGVGAGGVGGIAPRSADTGAAGVGGGGAGVGRRAGAALQKLLWRASSPRASACRAD